MAKRIVCILLSLLLVTSLSVAVSAEEQTEAAKTQPRLLYIATAEQFLEILALFGIDKDAYGLLDFILGIASSVFIWISAILCVISGAIYIIDNKDFIKQTK